MEYKTSKPTKCNDILFDDTNFSLTRIWTWSAEQISEINTREFLEVHLSDQSGYTFLSHEGERLTEYTFCSVGNFHDGLAHFLENRNNRFRYGFIDKNFRTVILPIYDEVKDFKYGRALVCQGEHWSYIDRTGQPYDPDSGKLPSGDHPISAEYSEGLCRFSTIDPLHIFPPFPVFGNHSDEAGNWGYADEHGHEIILPEYLFARDFRNGLAIVGKGSYLEDDFHENTRWGVIDKTGKTVVPFTFAAIENVEQSGPFPTVFSARKENHWDADWGLIDSSGNWLTDAIFHKIVEVRGNLLLFRIKGKYAGGPYIGLYDIKSHKTLLKPQFDFASFEETGYINAVASKGSVFPLEWYHKIIDQSGKKRFPGKYGWIHFERDLYRFSIEDNELSGFLNSDGSVKLPCLYRMTYVSYKHQFFVFESGTKYGIKSFNGKTIVPPIYDSVRNDGFELDTPIVTASTNDGKNVPRWGLFKTDGTTILPASYDEIIWCNNRRHILCCRNKYWEMFLLK